MADIDWQSDRACGRNERGPKLLTQPRPSKANVPDKEVTHMPFACRYDDSRQKFNSDFLTYDYRDLTKCLEAEGWRTPQTYTSSSFDSEANFPAVYVFLLVERDFYTRARPAYVGMSTKLAQRWSGHPILSEIEALDAYVQKWFLRVPRSDLREVEARHIHRFDPPWNVVGRKRGLATL